MNIPGVVAAPSSQQQLWRAEAAAAGTRASAETGTRSASPQASLLK
ncbi:hypothetical protein [Sinorhizobium sp. GL28]|nr:hypothetical protein [Sinorhizobium sp. GL28]